MLLNDFYVLTQSWVIDLTKIISCIYLNMEDSCRVNDGKQKREAEEGGVAEEIQSHIWFSVIMHRASLSLSYRSPRQTCWRCCSCLFGALRQLEKTQCPQS